jgi:tetratricopeptide (TPR) repeat protein
VLPTPAAGYGLPAAGAAVELVCLKHRFDAIRSRIPPRGPRVVVRPGISEVLPVPGEIFGLEVEHAWVFGHTRYAKGRIGECRADVARLDLTPLALERCFLWDPDEESEVFESVGHPVYEAIRAAGPRPSYEMEQILPDSPMALRWEDDPILEAAELTAAGAAEEAGDLLGELLTIDLRCLDAHAHLGALEFGSRWFGALDRARRHYRVGLEIADLTLGPTFEGLLPWGLIDNRPYLRCLHGYGLCLWRAGDLDGASEVFRRMLWLNPADNQGARFCLAAVEAGRSWAESEDEPPENPPSPSGRGPG